jgi:hypothetical protein
VPAAVLVYEDAAVACWTLSEPNCDVRAASMLTRLRENALGLELHNLLIGKEEAPVTFTVTSRIPSERASGFQEQPPTLAKRKSSTACCTCREGLLLRL